jgi:hypothetical protein
MFLLDVAASDANNNHYGKVCIVTNSTSTRRQVILGAVGTLSAGLLSGLVPGTAMAENRLVSPSYGGGGGASFPMQFPRRIGARGGNVVDALLLNGSQYGGGGGSGGQVEVLGADEYIDLVILRYGNVVDNLYMTTSGGRLVHVGGQGGTWLRLSEKPIRVLRIGGRSGSYLDQIAVEYVDDYRPSMRVDEGIFVLDVAISGSTYKTYNEASSMTAQAFSRTTTLQRSLSVKASVEGEYFSKFAVETEMSTSETTTEGMSRSAELRMKEGTERTIAVTGDTTAFLLGKGNIMRDAEGSHWMYPTALPGWALLDPGTYGRLRNHYDLTSSAATQTDLQTTKKYGFDFLV